MSSTITEPAIYWTLLNTEHGSLYVAATAAGLCFVGSLNGHFEELSHYMNKHYAGSRIIEAADMMEPYTDQLTQYWQGQRMNFTLPFDIQGTAFQQAVWKALGDIPFGQTVSYSEIAVRIQKPSAVRAVGGAIGANPLLITIPCHRVIGKNGALAGYRGGMEMKKKLLLLEKPSVAAQ